MVNYQLMDAERIHQLPPGTAMSTILKANRGMRRIVFVSDDGVEVRKTESQ